jgi:hypothetical protein
MAGAAARQGVAPNSELAMLLRYHQLWQFSFVAPKV